MPHCSPKPTLVPGAPKASDLCLGGQGVLLNISQGSPSWGVKSGISMDPSGDAAGWEGDPAGRAQSCLVPVPHRLETKGVTPGQEMPPGTCVVPGQGRQRTDEEPASPSPSPALVQSTLSAGWPDLACVFWSLQAASPPCCSQTRVSPRGVPLSKAAPPHPHFLSTFLQDGGPSGRGASLSSVPATGMPRSKPKNSQRARSQEPTTVLAGQPLRAERWVPTEAGLSPVQEAVNTPCPPHSERPSWALSPTSHPRPQG